MTEDDNLNGVAGEPAGDNVEASEATATEAKKDETTPPAQVETDGKASAGEPAGEEPKKPSGSARKAERIRELEARLAELEARAAKPAEQTAPPKLDDFPDWDTHQAALIEYAARKALAETSRTAAAEELSSVREETLREQLSAHEARVADARQRIPDYDKKLAEFRTAGHAPPTQEVVAMLIESDKSELLAYHLATRPDLVRELNRMPLPSAARRIGQIEARLSYPSPKTQSEAPPPMAGLRGGASPNKPLAEMSYEEYRRARGYA